jgi:thiol-disulfide isomerase/thioredoxin
MRRRLLSALLGSAMGFLVLFLQSNASAADAPVNWSVTDQNGKQIQSSSLLGRVTIVNFWATWCLPCLVEIPALQDLSAKYKKNGLAVVGITVDTPSNALLQAYMEKFKINYTVAAGNRDMMHGFHVGDSVPMTFVLDRQGNIVHKHVGYVRKEDLEKDVRDVLKL